MFQNLEHGPCGNVFTPETKQGDWTGYVKCPRNSEVQWGTFLSFKEQSAGHLHFAQSIIEHKSVSPIEPLGPFPGHEWAFRFGATHQLLGDNNHITYARIYKTQVWVMVDENPHGEPVWEKWSIRNLKPYWP